MVVVVVDVVVVGGGGGGGIDGGGGRIYALAKAYGGRAPIRVILEGVHGAGGVTDPNADSGNSIRETHKGT